MMLLLATSPPRVDLSKGAEALEAASPSIAAAVAAAAVGLALIVLAWLAATRFLGSDSERAFRALARHLRLPRSERLLLRRLASSAPNASPAALLLSAHARNAAIARVESDLDPRDKAHAVRIEARLSG